MPEAEGQEWLAYYERFDYFSTAVVRDGCHLRIFYAHRTFRQSHCIGSRTDRFALLPNGHRPLFPHATGI